MSAQGYVRIRAGGYSSWSIADSGARFELFGGPCCDNLECPSREGWAYPGESREQFVVRLRTKYAGEA